ncbi:hypothetical protein CALVIDRAFT_137796 [Calocera viscosa TUFC12733]|uniref:Uncharacterized protein n=1 Tax=Calocera viscosa (strain TUFC12733) TaxID=1330018 RepID=A0A167M087_CALVF|nr:hypothetical protein CALVIDRAFT_137796 [Calocera viscosa TUFC12733]
MSTIHSISSESSEAQPLTPPFLTPMSSYRDPRPHADPDVDGEAQSVTSLPLGPLITADGRTHIPSPEPEEAQDIKTMPGDQDQTSPSRFFEPFPEGPIPAHQFRPRREFIPSIHAPHEFALLTLAEGNLVRMLGFDEEAVRTVRDVLASTEGERLGIRSERRGNAVEANGRKSSEDRVMSPVRSMQSPVLGELVEWCLEGKPWKERKHSSEILLTTLFSTLLSHSFLYVSPLHLATPSSPVHLSAIFSRPLEPIQERKTAFSISFPAANIIRVIGAPKESTPGILAVVRQGWGTRLKEEKSEIGTWEGKLKGPGLFGPAPEPPGPEVVLDTLAAFNRQGIELMTIVRLAGTEMWLFDCSVGMEGGSTMMTPVF